MLSFYPFHVGCLSLVEYILRRKLEVKLEEKVPSSVAIQTFYYALDEVRDCLRQLPDLLSLQSGLHTFGIEYPHGYYGMPGSIVPFIFDLNARECHEKDEELEGTGTCWDWKLLCRWLKEEPFVEEARRLAVLDSPVPRDQFKEEANQCFMGSMIELLYTRETKLFEPPLELANRVRLFKTIEDALMLKPRGSRGTEERYAFMKGHEEIRILGIVEFDKID
ncbi:hypothetical protein HYALB_00004920 [Hymenoscyphus albidus]|uniref:Uncharacterized protein n=1 Tax=Hymenoscyphus albidus TaxID=595503 RepID=A0A9N9LG95_9HELO|nr:hypothetical protein HYALB_00004920 [Hymenoscyphus albidus]